MAAPVSLRLPEAISAKVQMIAPDLVLPLPRADAHTAPPPE